MKTLAVVALIAASACSNETTEGASSDHAVIVTTGSRKAYIVTPRKLTAEQVPSVLADGSVGMDWVRLELPSELQSSDLADSAAPVVFAQSYVDLCDPSDAQRTERCRLQERYAAGDAGLRGALQIVRTDSDLVIMYSVYWEGVTERFDGPPQWHAHESAGRVVIAADTVLEVDL